MVYQIEFRVNVPKNRDTQDEYIDSIAEIFSDVKRIRGFGTAELIINLDYESDSIDEAITTSSEALKTAMPSAFIKNSECLGICKFDDPEHQDVCL